MGEALSGGWPSFNCEAAKVYQVLHWLRPASQWVCMEVPMPGSRLDLGRQQSNRGFSKQLPRIFASVPLHLQAVSGVSQRLKEPLFLF